MMQKENKRNIEFMDLLEPCMEQLERFALSLCRNRHTAKDLVSESILCALESFHTLRDKKLFLKWIFTILHRKYISNLRRIIKRKIDDYAELDSLFGENVSPEDLIDISILYNAIDKLKPEEKSAIILFEVMGFTLIEISEIQGISIANAKVRLHRTRLKLKKFLGLIHKT